METLFREAGMHLGLARTVEQLGGERFWRQLILLLRQWLPFDNALATHIPPQGTPMPLELFDGTPDSGLTPMVDYLGGLYLLDPFHQSCCEGLPSGLHRLEEVAPDQFRQSEYFLSYFHKHVQEDEVQFILQLPGEGTLSLSLGMHRAFSAEEYGLLQLISAWVLALMQQHWQRGSASLAIARNTEIPLQIRDAMTQFGSGVLSERELEIARLVLRGYSSKAIAERLVISPDTVKVHRRHLYAKLDISSQPELFALFIQALGHDPKSP